MQIPSRIVAGVLAIIAQQANADSFSTFAVYSDDSCSDTPQLLSMVTMPSCTEIADTCAGGEFSGASIYSKASCTDDTEAFAQDAFGSTSYLTIETYSDTKCESLLSSQALLADGSCLLDSITASAMKVEVGSSGSVSVYSYLTSDCTGDQVLAYTYTSKEMNTCYAGSLKIFLSGDGATTTGTSDGDATTPTTSTGSSSSATSTTTTSAPIASASSSSKIAADDSAASLASISFVAAGLAMVAASIL